MKKYTFEHKCRRCGITAGQVTTTVSRTARNTLIGAIEPDSSLANPMVSLLEMHYCNDGGCGVADLIGYKVTESP